MRNRKSVLMTLKVNYDCFSGVGFGIAGNYRLRMENSSLSALYVVLRMQVKSAIIGRGERVADNGICFAKWRF